MDLRDADFLQVTLSEGQEDAEVHILLLEHLQVLQTANLLQQCCEILEGQGDEQEQGAGAGAGAAMQNLLLRSQHIFLKTQPGLSPLNPQAQLQDNLPVGRCPYHAPYTCSTSGRTGRLDI